MELDGLNLDQIDIISIWITNVISINLLLVMSCLALVGWIGRWFIVVSYRNSVGQLVSGPIASALLVLFYSVILWWNDATQLTKIALSRITIFMVLFHFVASHLYYYWQYYELKKISNGFFISDR